MFKLIFILLVTALVPNMISAAVDNVSLLRATAQVNKSFDLLEGSYKSQAESELLVRSELLYFLNSNIEFEMNIFATYGYYKSLSEYKLYESMSRWRSSKLSECYVITSNCRSKANMDRFNMTTRFGKFTLKLGRQAVNLSVANVFRPNDLFEPFMPTNFYRLYKPGVDVARLVYDLFEMTRLELIAVLAYKSQETTRFGDLSDENKENPENAAKLAVLFTNLWEVDYTVLLGAADKENWIYGVGLQTDIFSSNLRLEGHQIIDKDSSELRSAKVSLGLDYQLTQDLILSYEKFYNDNGYESRFDYAYFDSNRHYTVIHLARQYSAFSLNMQWAALLAGQYLVLLNETDGSALAAFYHVFSVNDETDITLTLSKSMARSAEDENFPSEYSLVDYSGSLSLNSYF